MAEHRESDYPVPEGWQFIHDNPHMKHAGLTYVYPNGDEVFVSDDQVRKNVFPENDPGVRAK